MWKALEGVLLVSVFTIAVLGLLLGDRFRSGIAWWAMILGMLVVSGLSVYRHRDDYRGWFRRK